jgi:hypothetical protein
MLKEGPTLKTPPSGGVFRSVRPFSLPGAPAVNKSARSRRPAFRNRLLFKVLSPERFGRHSLFIHAGSIARNPDYQAQTACSAELLTYCCSGGTRGPVGIWQRYEEATMRQRPAGRPHGPRRCGGPEHHGVFVRALRLVFFPRSGARFDGFTFAQERLKINTFLTTARESLGLR